MPGYSIHIGLNHVDPDAYGGWDGELSGCINDAHAMQRLATAEGYQSTLLLDEEATSQAVAGEISLLAQQVSAGDICLISYSGHGGQVDDVNGDESDGRDETWVLYDRQMVDDELYQLWSQFPAGCAGRGGQRQLPQRHRGPRHGRVADAPGDGARGGQPGDAGGQGAKPRTCPTPSRSPTAPAAGAPTVRAVPLRVPSRPTRSTPR